MTPASEWNPLTLREENEKLRAENARLREQFNRAREALETVRQISANAAADMRMGGEDIDTWWFVTSLVDDALRATEGKP